MLAQLLAAVPRPFFDISHHRRQKENPYQNVAVAVKHSERFAKVFDQTEPLRRLERRLANFDFGDAVDLEVPQFLVIVRERDQIQRPTMKG